MSRTEDQDVIAGYYDAYSTWYERERREGYYSLINDLEVERIVERAIGRHSLEIGCGTGLILERVAVAADVATAVDLSIGMAGVSRDKGLRVANASGTHLPFPADHFDVVYSCKVLAHIPDIRRAVSEIVRVTKPGGYAVLEFYNPTSFKTWGYRAKQIVRRGRHPVFIRFDSLDDVRSYLPDGVRIERVRGIRTLAPTSQFYTLPVVGPLFRSIDRAAADRWLGRRLGGYLLVELHVDG